MKVSEGRLCMMSKRLSGVRCTVPELVRPLGEAWKPLLKTQGLAKADKAGPWIATEKWKHTSTPFNYEIARYLGEYTNYFHMNVFTDGISFGWLYDEPLKLQYIKRHKNLKEKNSDILWQLIVRPKLQFVELTPLWDLTGKICLTPKTLEIANLLVKL